MTQLSYYVAITTNNKVGQKVLAVIIEHVCEGDLADSWNVRIAQTLWRMLDYQNTKN